MGFLARLRGAAGAGSSRGRADQLHIGDPRFEDWQVVRDFGEIESARSWRQHLEEIGIEAAIVSDYELDRFGRGEISLVVPGDRWSDAEEFLSNIDLD